MRTTTVRNGILAWVGLGTPDVDTAARFYRNLFGWQITTTGLPPSDVVCSVGDHVVAGMAAAGAAPGPATWTPFFHVDDLAGAVARVAACGGRIAGSIPRVSSDPHASMAADLGGALFGLTDLTVQHAPYFSQEPGRVAWMELVSSFPRRSAVFYEVLFDWQAMTDIGEGTTTLISQDSLPLARLVRTPSDRPLGHPDVWSPFFAVETCGATVDRALRLGGTTVRPCASGPMGQTAVIADPTGAQVQLRSPAGVMSDAVGGDRDRRLQLPG